MQETIDHLEESIITFVTLPSGRVLEVETFGEGDPVALLPGLGCTGSLFDLMKESLPRNRHFVILNLRGMGSSDPATSSYEIEDLAIDVLFAMNRLGHPCFDVVGVSLGGFVAQALADLTPWRVRSLCLISSTAGGEGFTTLPLISDQELEKFYELDPKVRAKLSVDATVHPLCSVQTPERYERLITLRTHPRMQAEQVIYQNQAAKRFLARPHRLGNLRCPTLVISGACDRFVPVQNARQLAREIDGAKLLLLAEADHLAVLEKAEECAHGLMSFLEEV